MKCNEFFDRLWREYIRLTPQAEKIHRLFCDDGNSICNDHVAFRTFNIAPINIAHLEPLVIALGYQHFDNYYFEEKKLSARSYTHDKADQPRIFISELIVEELSSQSQQLIHGFCKQINPERTDSLEVFLGDLLWRKPTWDEYQMLLAESEYAAWLSLLGLRANHFTISVNSLRDNDLHYVIERLQEQGIELNTEGGIIKGSPAVLLEQSATLADRTRISFADGKQRMVSTCYYEFAKRYHDANGNLYQGFVPANANKIFHSTDQRGRCFRETHS